MVLQYGTLTSRRPHLEYGATVWNPHFKKQITLIENVQRRATKQIPGLAHLSYLERLQLLKLPTLQYRRYRGDMIEMYKLSHGHYGEAATRSFHFRANKYSSQKIGTFLSPYRETNPESRNVVISTFFSFCKWSMNRSLSFLFVEHAIL